MELTRALGVERWREVLNGFLAIARAAIDEFGGTVNQFHGDGLLAVFGALLATRTTLGVIVSAIGEGLRMDFAPIGNTGGLGKRIESLAPEGFAALTRQPPRWSRASLSCVSWASLS